MITTSTANYRGFEERSSKNGNSYKVLKFEDETFSQVPFYARSDASFSVPVGALKRGVDYIVECNYHFNNFQNRWELNLTDIKEVKVNNNPTK